MNARISLPSTARSAIVGAALVASIALYRFLPHPPNVTPLAAAALLLPSLLWRVRRDAHAVSAPTTGWRRVLPSLLVLLALLAGDLAIEFGAGFGSGAGLHRHMPAVYGAMLLSTLLGGHVARGRSALIALVPASSAAFFVLTNLSVWALGDFYPRTWAGLGACFVAAIPFGLRTLGGDLGFTVLFALLGRVPLTRQTLSLRGGADDVSPTPSAAAG